jgi:hypothetical protein
MTNIRSYTSGQQGPYAAAASHARGGDFVNALQDAVRQNPISAALIGMGVLWMFMGGSNTSLFGGGGRKGIFSTTGQSEESVDGAVRNTAARVGSSIGDAANATAETTTQAAGVVRQASAAVGDLASRATGDAADALASAYDATTNAGSRAADTISNATTTAARTMQETGTKWGSTVQLNIADLFERQPLLLGAVGIAIGAGIAASIPTTEAENQVMGEASDFVREAVSEKVAQAKEMTDAAVHEVKSQGLTPEAARGALRIIGDKMGAVAQAAISTNPSTKGTSRGSEKS